jgi:hypothetical protein
MARQIKSATTSNRDGGGGRSGGRGSGRFNNSGRGGRGGGRGRGYGRGYGTPNTKSKPNGSGYYSPADWNKLSYEERDKIRKERDKKGEQGGTKRTIDDISVEHVTAIIGAMQQVPSIVITKDSVATNETTPSNQAGNAFGGKARAKKMRILVLLVVILCPFHTLEGFVMSPHTTSTKAVMKRTYQLSPVQQRTLVKQVDRPLFSLLTRACGPATNSHTLS